MLVHDFYYIGNCWYLNSVCRRVCYPEIIKLSRYIYVASDTVLYNVYGAGLYELLCYKLKIINLMHLVTACFDLLGLC